ncbi:MAG TPA: LON peptidase substrate-binding domain-containing protein [Vicinamibacterales bacterium]|nr:LON peptidase substrate-binding domain-containing protein [Vicinamibacterales bacterium]
MSDLLPLFPLPSVVLFPGVFLPLHIFEPRYRDMVADALATDRLIGMTLLRGGWEGEYERQPPIYAVGCSGLITHCEKLPDGRYNLVLRGLDRFRVVSEDHARPYRRARTEPIPERDLSADERGELRRLRSRIEVLIAPSEQGSGIDPRATAAMSDDDLVNALAQYLDLEPIEKQALLEQPTLPSRARALIELLEMKTLLAGRPSHSPRAH